MAKQNIKHAEFVAEYFKNGFNATKAYLSVYGGEYDNAKVNSCKLLTNPNIHNEIKIYKEDVSNKIDNLKEMMVNTLIDISLNGSEPNKIKAINELNKMLGSHIETKNINISGDLKDMFGFEDK